MYNSSKAIDKEITIHINWKTLVQNSAGVVIELMQSNLSGSSLKTICLITFSSPLLLYHQRDASAKLIK